MVGVLVTSLVLEERPDLVVSEALTPDVSPSLPGLAAGRRLETRFPLNVTCVVPTPGVLEGTWHPCQAEHRPGVPQRRMAQAFRFHDR